MDCFAKSAKTLYYSLTSLNQNFLKQHKCFGEKERMYHCAYLLNQNIAGSVKQNWNHLKRAHCLTHLLLICVIEDVTKILSDECPETMPTLILEPYISEIMMSNQRDWQHISESWLARWLLTENNLIQLNNAQKSSYCAFVFLFSCPM